MLAQARLLQQLFKVSKDSIGMDSLRISAIIDKSQATERLFQECLACRDTQLRFQPQVLEWSATQQLLPRAGRFASFPDWRTAVNKRSSALQHVTPFLQDLLAKGMPGGSSQVPSCPLLSDLPIYYKPHACILFLMVLGLVCKATPCLLASNHILRLRLYPVKGHQALWMHAHCAACTLSNPPFRTASSIMSVIPQLDSASISLIPYLILSHQSCRTISSIMSMIPQIDSAGISLLLYLQTKYRCAFVQGTASLTNFLVYMSSLSK